MLPSSPDARHSSERAGNNEDPLPLPPYLPCPFGDRMDHVCSSYVPVNFPSFQKLSVAAASKPRLQALCGTYQASPCFGAPATGLLDLLKFPCTPVWIPLDRILSCFFINKKKSLPLRMAYILALLRNCFTQIPFLNAMCIVPPHACMYIQSYALSMYYTVCMYVQ